MNDDKNMLQYSWLKLYDWFQLKFQLNQHNILRRKDIFITILFNFFCQQYITWK